MVQREVCKAGWLQQKNRAKPLKTAVCSEEKYYLFCVHNGRIPLLEQYMNDKSSSSHEPQKVIDLLDCNYVSATIEDDRSFLIGLHEITLELVALNEEEKRDWIHLLTFKLQELKELERRQSLSDAATPTSNYFAVATMSSAGENGLSVERFETRRQRGQQRQESNSTFPRRRGFSHQESTTHDNVLVDFSAGSFSTDRDTTTTPEPSSQTLVSLSDINLTNVNIASASDANQSIASKTCSPLIPPPPPVLPTRRNYKQSPFSRGLSCPEENIQTVGNISDAILATMSAGSIARNSRQSSTQNASNDEGTLQPEHSDQIRVLLYDTLNTDPPPAIFEEDEQGTGVLQPHTLHPPRHIMKRTARSQSSTSSNCLSSLSVVIPPSNDFKSSGLKSTSPVSYDILPNSTSGPFVSPNFIPNRGQSPSTDAGVYKSPLDRQVPLMEISSAPTTMDMYSNLQCSRDNSSASSTKVMLMKKLNYVSPSNAGEIRPVKEDLPVLELAPPPQLSVPIISLCPQESKLQNNNRCQSVSLGECNQASTSGSPAFDTVVNLNHSSGLGCYDSLLRHEHVPVLPLATAIASESQTRNTKPTALPRKIFDVQQSNSSMAAIDGSPRPLRNNRSSSDLSPASPSSSEMAPVQQKSILDTVPPPPPRASRAFQVQANDTSRPTSSVVTLKQAEVEKLKKEMAEAGIKTKLPTRDAELLALVEVCGKVWVAGWKQSTATTRIGSVLHLGDQLLKVVGETVSNLKKAEALISNCRSDKIDLLIKRTPLAYVFLLCRDADGQDVGLVRQPKKNLVTRIERGSVADRSGVPSKVPVFNDPSSKCAKVNLVLTEINSRPISLCAKDDEAGKLLSAVGRELPIVLQPEDFISAMKKQLKQKKGYKDYLLS